MVEPPVETQMHCTACKNDNPDDALFCNACGASLELRCSSCDKVNPPASRFCNGCGTALSAPTTIEQRDPRDYTPRHLAEKILHHKGALEGERKQVTVLFADLVGSTALAERIDAEEMHGLMDRAFQVILQHDTPNLFHRRAHGRDLD